LLAAGLYYLSSFVPYVADHGARYPFIDFRVPARFWGVELARDTLLTLLRIGAVAVAATRPRWRRAGWGALVGMGAIGLVTAIDLMVRIVNALNPGVPLIGAYLYIASALITLWAGLLGLQRARESPLPPEDHKSTDVGEDVPEWHGERAIGSVPLGLEPAPVQEAGPKGQGEAKRAVSRRFLTIGCTLALAIPLAVSPLTAKANYGPSYRFLSLNPGGSPVRWDPCRSIHYVENLSEAPPGIQPTIDQALREISDATGIIFINDGLTTEPPTRDRSGVQPRYGMSYAPVLIVWAKPGEGGVVLPELYGREFADWVAIGGGSHEYVSGEIVLNATSALPVGFASSTAWGPVLLHELGHLAGLAHVRSPFEIMQPGPDFVRHYGRGDLQGLHRLGRSAGCLT
jgi:hypothetical protein